MLDPRCKDKTLRPSFYKFTSQVSLFNISCDVALILAVMLLVLLTGPITGTTGFSSIQFSHSVVSDSLRSHGLQHARPPCPSPTPRVYSNSCPFSP